MYLNFKDMPATMVQKDQPSIRRTCREMKGLLLPLSAIIVGRGFMHACLTAFLPLYIIQQSGNVWLAGIALTLFEAAGVVGILAVGTLSDRFGRKKLLGFCLVVSPVAFLLFNYTSGWPQLLILLIIGFSLLSTTPIMLAMVQEFSADGSAAANGVFMMISFLARSAVVVLVGFVADLFGLKETYLLCGIIGLVAIPFILALGPGKNIESKRTV
jgi:FSR family fosmidomycin resistance protein-like MFS transporter